MKQLFLVLSMASIFGCGVCAGILFTQIYDPVAFYPPASVYERPIVPLNLPGMAQVFSPIADGFLLESEAEGILVQVPIKESSLPHRTVLSEYLGLYQKNPDMVGWLEIPGTDLHTPVMFTPWDRELYLRRGFDGMKSIRGTPFIDGDCMLNPRSTNVIIHGHNLDDGLGFGVLLNYTDKEFYKKHPTIRFDTLYEHHTYEIIAVFLSVYDETDTGPDLYYNFIDALSPEEYHRYIRQVRGFSLYRAGKAPVEGDDLITLITCSYHAEEGRMNVVAKKISNEET